MEYTKGEWKAGNVDVVTESTHIANCYTESNFKRPPIGEALANAHLIAAAPDNYKRLRETTILLESILAKFVLSGSDESIKRTIRDNKQALAKAEGK